LCRIYHTSEEHLAEASDLVEDAFKISQHPVEERELILEVVS
jgi:thymidine phosphorylase